MANAKKIYALLQQKTQVHWQRVKGHSGAKHNEQADALAERGKQLQDYQGGREEAENFCTLATVPSESTPPEDKLDKTLDSTSKVSYRPCQRRKNLLSKNKDTRRAPRGSRPNLLKNCTSPKTKWQNTTLQAKKNIDAPSPKRAKSTEIGSVKT